MVLSRPVEALRKGLGRPLVRRLRALTVPPRLLRAGTVDFLGRPLQTAPGVFHPTLLLSSRVLAEALRARGLRGLSVLDMGTGAGPVAVIAASEGARVTAVDCNPAAVTLARENLRANGLGATVHHGDLFAPLRDERFDLIAFNLPFYAGSPKTDYDRAFFAGEGLDTIVRFARGAPAHLRSGGEVWALFSEDSDRAGIERAFADAGLALRREQVAQVWLERFHLWVLQTA